MLKAEIQEALNKHINAEFYSSYLYLSMAAWLDARNLTGMAAWMKAQAQEEWGHGMKIYGYLYERGGQVKLDGIQTPPTEWKCPVGVFEEVAKHEEHVTSLIYGLVELAQSAKDHATNGFLQWFIKEQVEEEATAADILHKLKMIGDSPNGLFLLDRSLGERK
jgi:ferritin